MNLKLRIKQLVFFTFILVGSIAFAQQSVSGTVSDNEGPLPGVSVIIKGTAQGVVTDFDGNYTISVSNQEAELVFSYLGFLTQEITVGSNSNLDVQLIEDVQGLEEVVVTGYGTQKKATLTGSIATIGGEALEKSSSPNLGTALAGKVVLRSVRSRSSQVLSNVGEVVRTQAEVTRQAWPSRQDKSSRIQSISSSHG